MLFRRGQVSRASQRATGTPKGPWRPDYRCRAAAEVVEELGNAPDVVEEQATDAGLSAKVRRRRLWCAALQ